jgi:uncharacterized protein (DUF433 family)
LSSNVSLANPLAALGLLGRCVYGQPCGCSRVSKSLVIGNKRSQLPADAQGCSVDHQIMGGVPCVAGTRIPVATVVGLIADGLSTADVVAEYPQLTVADVRACLGYAARAVDERELPVRLSA